MKKLLLVGLLLMACTLQAQNTKIGIKINPELTVKFSDEDKGGGTYAKTYTYNYLRIGFGAQIVRSITKHLSFESGVYIHKQKFSFRTESVYKIYSPDGWFNYYKDDYTEEKIYTFLQIPLAIRYDVEKIGYASFGFTSNYQFTTKHPYHNTDAKDLPKGDKYDNTFAVGALMTLGHEWPIKNNISAITEFRFSGIPGRGAGIVPALGLGVNYKL